MGEDRAYLSGAEPQLFVGDMARAVAFYTGRLGFAVVFLYGTPPYYGQVARDGVRLNLRHTDTPPVDPVAQRRDELLSATILVDRLDALFAELAAQGTAFEQPLQRQPWGARRFIVRDPDGNLLMFMGD